MPKNRKSRWLRRLKWPAIILALLIVLIYGILPLIVTPMIRLRLQKQISTQLNADLAMGGVYYAFPYGVSVSDAVLVAKDEQGQAVQLLNIPKLRLSLAKLPFGEGPLVIKKFALTRPTIHLIDTENGIVGRRTLVKKDATQTTQPSHQERGKKLSEMLELRRVTIKDAQIIYEDRESPQTVPAAWRNIDIDLTTTPAANPLYQFNLSASSGSLAELHAAGTLDVDELELTITQITSKLSLAAQDKESPVPAGVQRLLLDNNVSGSFSIAGTARAPLRKMEDAQFDLHVKLDDGSARIAAWQSEKDRDQKTFDRIIAVLHCSSEPLTSDQELMATAGQLRAAQTRPTTRATTRAAQPKMPAAYLLVENGEIRMGDNLLEVKNAAAAYDRRLREWQLNQARATLTLGKHKEDLPKPLRAAVDKPRFFGVVELTLNAHGSMNKPRGRNAHRPYQIMVKATSPELLMTPRRLVAANVSCNMLITPGLVQFVDEDAQHPAISANLYGGSLVAHGAIRTGKPVHFDMAANLESLDLRSLARDWTHSEEKLSHLSGRAFATLQLSTASSHGGKDSFDLLSGQGTFEVIDGEFYELPVLSEIASAITLSKDAAKVGQAAGRFHLANRRIHFNRIAVAAPALGVQGEGYATFGGQLDFKVVAAPLADWKAQLQKTKIPLLDSVGAELVGGVQKILDTASGKLLYQFKISGTTAKPQVTPEAVPILTEDGMKLLKDMLKGTGRLLDEL